MPGSWFETKHLILTTTVTHCRCLSSGLDEAQGYSSGGGSPFPDPREPFILTFYPHPTGAVLTSHSPHPSGVPRTPPTAPRTGGRGSRASWPGGSRPSAPPPRASSPSSPGVHLRFQPLKHALPYGTRCLTVKSARITMILVMITMLLQVSFLRTWPGEICGSPFDILLYPSHKCFFMKFASLLLFCHFLSPSTFCHSQHAHRLIFITHDAGFFGFVLSR